MKDASLVLYEDTDLLAVVKEAGDLTQGDATGDASMQEEWKRYLTTRGAAPDAFLGIVHRLDRPVSGVILFARTREAAAHLSEQFRSRSLEKIYHAVVEGKPKETHAKLAHYIGGSSHRMRVSASTTQKPNTKRAELEYRVLGSIGSRSLVEVHLLTGVKHQIRAQLAAIGCPIVGDFKYDQRPKSKPRQQLADGRGIALHALRLTVEHPTQHKDILFEAPLPAYWPWKEEWNR